MKHYVSIRHNGSLGQIPTAWLFLGLLAPSAALLALVWSQPWVPAAYLVRDSLVVAREAPKCCGVYYGAVSNLGIILWMATAAVCLFTALVAHAVGAAGPRAAFFLAGGLFTLWLGLDDFFLVREEALPYFGVPRTIANMAYAAMGLIYLIAAWRIILAGRISLFLIASVMLAGSMSLDILVGSEAPFWIFLKDALKFVGITFWAGFHIAEAAAAAEDFATGRITTVQMASGAPIRRLMPAKG